MPPGMVWVPGGTFQMGDDVYPEEGPTHSVTVTGFFMDAHEVTNAEFAAFVTATGYRTIAERGVLSVTRPDMPAEMLSPGAAVFSSTAKGEAPVWHYVDGASWRHPLGPGSSIEKRDQYPVVAVALADAQAYAVWKGAMLPTEAQWEWAAMAADPKAPREHHQPTKANTWQGPFPEEDTGADGYRGLAPVARFAPNRLGLFDLIGNVWEWTSTPWSKEPPARRVIKGGSYLCSSTFCRRYRAGARQPQEADLATCHLGFRTVRAAATQKASKN